MTLSPWSIVFATASLAMLLVALHPVTTYPLSLMIVRQFGRRRLIVSGQPACSKYTIVFCAYNEAAVIRAKLGNLLQLKEANPKCDVELLAYSDASSDGTEAVMREYAREIRVFGGSARRGKSHGMNTLLAHASGDVVIFTDANVLLDEGVFAAFDRSFSDETVGVACGNLQYINRETATAGVGTDYWRFEEYLKQLETDTGSTMGADGSIFAIRRSLFAPVPEDIVDDFYTSMRILCEGYRVVRCGAAIAYERSVDSVGQEGQRKVRIACRAFNCHKLLAPNRRRMSWLDKYKYFSHKWIRWMTFMWLLLSYTFLTLACTIQYGPLIGLVCLLPPLLGVGVLFAASHFHLPVLSKIWVVLVILYATQRGIIQSLRGQRYQTWNPPQSSRTAFGAKTSSST